MPELPPVPQARKVRDITGLDVYQVLAEDLPEKTYTLDKNGHQKFNIGKWRQDCKQAWEALDDEQRLPYNSIAIEKNSAREQAEEGEVSEMATTQQEPAW